MEKEIIQFEVSSPEELQDALAAHEPEGSRFAGVRVLGPNILTRQFNFPNSSIVDLIAGLKHEASEILSVRAVDVEISYQITSTDEQGVHGIFLAMSRQLLMEYLDCFKSHALIPVSLTAAVIDGINDFLKDQPHVGDNFCLVNFLKPQAVSIIIFTNGRPAFFRELYDLSDSDFKDKITDTIRYSCSHSASKRIDQIFFIGDLDEKDTLIKSLKELGNFSSVFPVSTGRSVQNDFTDLNLWGKLVCGLQERKRLVSIFSLVAVISVLLGIFLAWNYAAEYLNLQNAKSRMNINDYYQALELQEQVGHLSHE